jgi:undecaprenyl-diphosphatase
MLVATPATGPSPRRHPLLARLTRLDEAASQTVATRWSHPRWFTVPLSALSLTANYGLLWFVIAALPWVTGDDHPPVRYIYVAAPVFATEVITYLLKALVGRRRPSERDAAAPAQIPLPKSRSFPSSHASMGMVGLLAMGHLYPAWLPALAVLVLLIAFSRVYLAVHYLGDVLAGLVLGTILGLGYLYVVVYLLQ